MRLVDQFSAVERELPERWGTARLHLKIEDEGRCDRAAALLGPATPGRLGNEFHFGVGRAGAALGPEAVRRLLRRLDVEAIAGRLELVDVEEAAREQVRQRTKLREQWNRELARLPPDWSDLYGEIRLTSTDFLERAALLLSPVNPARYGGATGLRFRSARTAGYGTSPEMVARCLERCDEEGITGELEILRVLSDTFHVATQGPVWYVGGRAV